MHVDWSIPVGTILLVIVQFVVGIIGLMRAFAAIERSIDSRFTQMEKVMAALKDGDMRELQGRVARLEAGADEWTKVLRERTHEHANMIGKMELEIDRLKRPERYASRKDDLT